MRRTWILVALVTISTRDLPAATPATNAEILAFTGAHARFVWTRWPWCDDNYQPNPSRRDARVNTKLCVYDTDEGQTRYIDDQLGNHTWARISRSGNWVVWNDYANSCVWIRDFKGTTARKKFLPQSGSSACFAGGWWVDAVTKKEYVYCLNFTENGGGTNQVFKVGVKSDGSADMADITTITLPGSSKLDMALSVSQNGAKIGCAYPWPDTYIYDVTSRTLAGRHLGVFGCQANLAPDNSYRFFHCRDDHEGLNMWDADMSTTMSVIDLMKGLPGLPSGTTTDFDSPRWSNHVQYFSNTYPLQLSYRDPPDDSGEDFMWGQSAPWVQNTAKRHWISSFVLGKFAADFKSVEKYVMIATDARYWEFGNDTWLQSGVTVSGSTVDISARRAVDLTSGAQRTVRVADIQGRLVHRAAIRGSAAIGTRDLAAGVYAVSLDDRQGLRTTFRAMR